MLYPDTETQLQLAREHQAVLKRDALLASSTRTEAVESRGRRHRLHLRWLWIRLRPAGHLSWR